ncbi:unnamed protein product, partial [Ectocarpus sp. 12 AP-2014]
STCSRSLCQPWPTRSKATKIYLCYPQELGQGAMASAVDRVQMRLQEAMDQGNQASLGQAIDASKGVNGLKQLRRSAKARLKQLSADQNRSMIGSRMQQQQQQQTTEEPLTWRTSEQGGRYRAVAHLPTSIIGWVIGHKGCNARMLKQQTGTELWVDVPGQCVIIESRAIQEVEGAMETVNDFVKTAPTFIAKAQSTSGGGVTQTVQCPVHLLPSIQRLSRKIQAESGANCVFANCKMSTFCVTGDRKNVDKAVAMLKRLIAEGSVEHERTHGAPAGGNGNIAGGNTKQQQHQQHHLQQQQQHHHHHHQQLQQQNNAGGDRRVIPPGSGGGAGMHGPAGDLAQRLSHVGSDMSHSDGSPPTAPCSPEVAQAVNAWGNGASSHLRTWNNPQQPLHHPQQEQQQHQLYQQHQQQLHHHHHHHQQQTLQQEQDPRLSTPTMASASAPPPPPPILAAAVTAPPAVEGPLPPPHTELAPSHYPLSAPATPGGTAAPFQGSSAATPVGGGGGGGASSSDLSFFSFGVGGASPPAPPGGAPAPRASTAPTPGSGGGFGGCGGSGGGTPGGGLGIGLPGLGFLEESAGGAGSRLGY